MKFFNKKETEENEVMEGEVVEEMETAKKSKKGLVIGGVAVAAGVLLLKTLLNKRDEYGYASEVDMSDAKTNDNDDSEETDSED